MDIIVRFDYVNVNEGDKMKLVDPSLTDKCLFYDILRSIGVKIPL